MKSTLKKVNFTIQKSHNNMARKKQRRSKRGKRKVIEWRNKEMKKK